METSGFRFAVVWGVALTAQLAACAGASPDEPPVVPGPEAVAGWRMVDLSHAYGASTLYWPTDTTGFQLDTLARGQTPGGYFYAAKQFATAEHGGTHLDAPSHFAEGGDDAASVPLDRLILPGIVVDVSEAAAADADYLLTAEDVLAWEGEHGRVPDGAAVLIRTAGRRAGRTRSLSRRRHAGRVCQPALSRHRRGGGAPAGGGSPRGAPRHRHRQRGPRPVDRLHRPPGRRRGRRPQPGERRGPLRIAADRVPARRAADEDRRWDRRAGPDRRTDPAALTLLFAALVLAVCTAVRPTLHAQTPRRGLFAALVLAVCTAVRPTLHAQTPAAFVPVTDAMLQAPSPGDWLMWRRTLDGWGYSPLDQIDRTNVGDLRLAWSLVRNRMSAARKHRPWPDRDRDHGNRRRRPAIDPAQPLEPWPCCPSKHGVALVVGGPAEGASAPLPDSSSHRSSHCADDALVAMTILVSWPVLTTDDRRLAGGAWVTRIFRRTSVPTSAPPRPHYSVVHVRRDRTAHIQGWPRPRAMLNRSE